MMRERLRFGDLRRGRQLSIFAGLGSFTIGVDVDRHPGECAITVHLGFVQVVLEWLRGGYKACRICGCTDDRACPGSCAWVTDPQGLGPLCSRCVLTVTGKPAA